mgnify:CR=1 FL=1
MRLPAIKPKELIMVLKKLGYIEKRQTGSHKIFYHPFKKKIIPVPWHNKDLKRGLLRVIIRELEISRERFLQLLRE